jgi:hypothetical protein
MCLWCVCVSVCVCVCVWREHKIHLLPYVSQELMMCVGDCGRRNTDGKNARDNSVGCGARSPCHGPGLQLSFQWLPSRSTFVPCRLALPHACPRTRAHPCVSTPRTSTPHPRRTNPHATHTRTRAPQPHPQPLSPRSLSPRRQWRTRMRTLGRRAWRHVNRPARRTARAM